MNGRMIKRDYVLCGTYIYFINFFIWFTLYHFVFYKTEINNQVYEPIAYFSILGRFIGFALIFLGISYLEKNIYRKKLIYKKAFWHQLFCAAWYLLNLLLESNDKIYKTEYWYDDLFQTTIIIGINNLFLFICLVFYLLRWNR